MKNKNIWIGVVVGVIIIIAIIAFASSDRSDSMSGGMSTTTVVAKLTAHPWVWTETAMNNDDVITPRAKDAFTVTFTADGKVSGTTDCNGFMGTYTVGANNAISFGPLAMTKMFCQGSQESVFTGYLSQASSTHFTDTDDLVLLLPFDSGSVMFAAKTTPVMTGTSSYPQTSEPVGFANLSYRLIGYKNMSVPADSKYTLTFSGANGISAKFCNSMSGTYTREGDKIKAPALISTLMACTDSTLMDIESAFGKALADGVTVAIQGNYLTLTDAAYNRFTFELVR